MSTSTETTRPRFDTTGPRPVRRRKLYPTTELRETRLRRGLTLSDVAARAGLSLTRASYVERDPSIADNGEIDALRSAVESLARELANLGGGAA